MAQRTFAAFSFRPRLRELGLGFLNALLHVIHLGVIAFLVLGWAFARTRAFHLAFIFGTLCTWEALGFCPLTELHWLVRRAAGLPGSKGPYVPFLLSRLKGRAVDAKRVDKIVVRLTLLIALLSAAVNAEALF